MTDIVPATPAVPALAYNNSVLDLGAEDIALPRIKIGQFMTAAVQEGLVKAGDIFSSTGEGDAEVLATQGDRVRFHVLTVTRGRSITVDGQLLTYGINDPDAPSDAWITYNYVVCLPSVDTDVPFKWLMTRTAAPTAKQINTVLARNSARGPVYALAFDIFTVQKENAKGKYYVPRVAQVEAEAADVDAAAKLAAMVAGSVPEQSASAGAVEPAI